MVCNGPLEHYEFLVKAEELKNDEQQRKVIQCLQKLHENLKGYSISSKHLLSKVGLNCHHHCVFLKSRLGLFLTPDRCAVQFQKISLTQISLCALTECSYKKISSTDFNG